MAAKLNLWSLTLLPGEKYPLYVRRDFVVTNAALGEELRSNDGRSVVKVTHHPIPPHMFDSDSDSEFDSDDDEELDEEDDEDAESQYELDVEEGFKLTPKKDKVNGDAIEEDDAEEDDDEGDEDEDDDFSDDEVEETSVLCSLTAGRIEQATLDLTFVEGDAVMFEVTGENAVHLMGNYVIQPNPHSHDDDDSDYDSEDFDDEHDDYSELYGDLESDDEETGKITEISDLIKEKPKAAAKKVEAAPVESKKRKADAVESPAPKAAASAAADADALSKNQKKKLAKKAKTEEAAPVAAAKPAAAKAAAPQEKKGGKKTLPSGLVIEDVKVGDGPVARTGKRLGMRYIGKLENGKQFDANTAGKPFSFVLGKGEVIRGWDEGLAGMAVGGERRLTIPAGLAYGSQKLPGIPKNSTLKFDVKLVSVN